MNISKVCAREDSLTAKPGAEQTVTAVTVT
jgi:hypothetical protein